MKKNLIFFVGLFLIAFSATAEINEPHRYVELGVEAQVNVANNWVSAGDFFPEDGVFVIDFNTMYNELLDGLRLGLDLDQKLFLNINAKKAFRLGITESIYGGGGLGISRGFLDLIAHGNPDGSLTSGGDMYGSMYADLSISLMTFLKNFAGVEGKDLGIRVTPSLFLPVVVLDPSSSADISVDMSGSGKIHATGTMNVLAYTLFDVNNLDDFVPETALSAAGYDLSLYAEYPVLTHLDLGLNLKHIPIIPARPPYEMKSSVDFDVSIESLMDDDLPDMEDLFNDPDAKFKRTDKKILRPFELGLVAAYRPVSWLALRPSFNVVFDKPFYSEYGLGAELHWRNWVSLMLSSNYERRQFSQRLNLMFNVRIFEIGLMVESRSPDFIKSFTGAGFGAGLGIKLGF